MAQETELERLVVRLVGDGSSYLKMLQEAQAAHDKAAKHLESGWKESLKKAGEHFTDFTKDVGKDVANRLLGGFGFGALAGGLATGLVHLFENAMEVAERYEKTEIGLNSVLQGNYRNVVETTEAYEQFADVMDKTTTASRIQTLNMLKLAEAHRLTGDAAKNAVKEAIALSGGDRDPETMLRITAAVNEGNIQQAMAMGRLIPELRGIKNEEAYLVEYYHQVNVKMEEQARLATTSGEKWKKNREELDRLEVGLGKFGHEMGNIALNAGKWSGHILSQPFLEALEKLGKPVQPTVQPNEEALEALKEMEDEANREKARQALAKAGTKDLKDWVDDLKEEAKYANIASEAERRLAKDRDRGAIVDEKGLANLEKAKGMVREIELLKKEGEAKKGLKDMVDTLANERFDTQAKARGDLYWNSQLEKFARVLPFSTHLIGFLREYNAETKAMAAAQEVREGMRTPEEKLNDELTKLFDLVMRGKLTWDEYGKAADAARDKILGVAAALTDAAGAGTSAAVKGLYEQVRLLQGNPTGGPNLPNYVQRGPAPRVVDAGMGEGVLGQGEGMGGHDALKKMDALVNTLQAALSNGLRIGFVEVGG